MSFLQPSYIAESLLISATGNFRRLLLLRMYQVRKRSRRMPEDYQSWKFQDGFVLSKEVFSWWWRWDGIDALWRMRSYGYNLQGTLSRYGFSWLDRSNIEMVVRGEPTD